MTTLLVFGLGYLGRATVARMRPRLEAVWGTTRDTTKIREIAALGVTPILFSGARQGDPSPDPSPQGGGGLATALRDADHVLVSIAPDEDGDPVLRHFRDELVAAKPKALVYLSTVGVYGDHGGAWVDETSECRPVSKRSRLRVAAEEEWRRFSEETGVPVAILRLAGIYGPGRGPFEKIRAGTARQIVKPGQVFNRIHVGDIAQIVEAAFERRASGIFNGVDDEPAPPEDVLLYAAELLGAPPPPEVAFEAAELSPMARSFYGESKRVRNDKIKRELGIALTYPTYREGLKAILAAIEPIRR
jgi:nucleoside-diphosphate-sugar epimerase